MSNPQIVVVTNRKGGAGKTTVTVNLATELAVLGKKVLILDLDTQGHCAVGLGVKIAAGEFTVHDIFNSPELSLVNTIKKTNVDNLLLSPANPLFEHGQGGNDECYLKNALNNDAINKTFDFIIIDTPPSLDILLLNALCCANWVLVPYVPHPLSLEGVRQLMRVLFRVMSKQNSTLKILGFLPVMVSNNVRQHRQINEKVSQQFGVLRVFSGIRSDIKLAEAFASHKPIRFYAPKSRGAEDFSVIAKNILDAIG